MEEAGKGSSGKGGKKLFENPASPGMSGDHQCMEISDGKLGGLSTVRGGGGTAGREDRGWEQKGIGQKRGRKRSPGTRKENGSKGRGWERASLSDYFRVKQKNDNLSQRTRRGGGEEGGKDVLRDKRDAKRREKNQRRKGTDKFCWS